MRISEKCSCGASVDMDHQSGSTVMEYVKEWREKHKHIVRSNPPYYTTTYAGGAA